jgi:hypothetical protein
VVAAALLIISSTVGAILLFRSSDSPKPAANTAVNTGTTATQETDPAVVEYQDELNKSWTSLRDLNVELVKKDKEVVDQATLNSFSALLTVATDKTEQIRNEIGRIEAPEDYGIRHQNLIDAIGSHRDYLKALLAVTSVDPAKVASSDFEPVSTAAENAQKKIVASQKQLPFLRALPDECFLLHTTLNNFYTAIWQKPVPAPAPAPAPAPTPAPAPAPAPVPAGSEEDAILAMVLSDSAGSWAGADNYEVVSYDPTTNSAIVLVTYYLPTTIRYSELYCDKDQYGWYVSYENTYEVPY